MTYLDELYPHLIDCEPQIAPIEELKSFTTDSRDTPVFVGRENLSTTTKEKLKCFLHENLDVFAWKHEDVVGIDPKVSCHHLKINPNATPRH